MLRGDSRSPPVGVDVGARAKDLYLLSSLKEAEGKEAAGDLLGAAAVIEGVSVRFPGTPEGPIYLLRAMRLYAKGGRRKGQEMGVSSEVHGASNAAGHRSGAVSIG